MVTIVDTINHEKQIIYVRTIDADAASGEMVLPGKPTDRRIRHEANEQLAAPECGNYDGYDVEWIG